MTSVPRAHVDVQRVGRKSHRGNTVSAGSPQFHTCAPWRGWVRWPPPTQARLGAVAAADAEATAEEAAVNEAAADDAATETAPEAATEEPVEAPAEGDEKA